MVESAYRVGFFESSTIRLTDHLQFRAMVESSHLLPRDGSAPRYLHQP